ncbi:MAG: Gfo/Idh/MocA family protein [Georgenia sp.]
MKRLKVAFLSGVRHATDYLHLLGSDNRIEVVAVAEEATAPAWMRADSRRAAERAGVPYTEALNELLATGSVDLLVVCSEPTRHARLATLALRSGHHVLIDKPATTTHDDAFALERLSVECGLVCAVVNRTHAPALRRLRGWVDAGHLGLPRHLDLEFLASGAHFATSVERPELVTDLTLAGGGEMLNFLGYCTDAVYVLTGLETRQVSAMSDALFSPSHQAARVEDTAVVTLELERGVTVTITIGRVSYAPGSSPTTSSVRILGSHGHAEVEDERPAVSHFGPAGCTLRTQDAGQVAVRAYLRHVVAAVLAGESPDYTITDARRTLTVIDAAYRSVRTGQVVTLHGA